MGDLAGRSVTVMGLGLHGGGLAAAQFLHRQGANVTVTDLRDEDTLAPVLAQLPAGIRTVLGTHREEDFTEADLVVKNPAVRRDNRLLKSARRITTDIALFLHHWRSGCGGGGGGGGGGDCGPLVAVTGTKGKSTTASVAAHLLRQQFPGTRLGGNITVSPLTFLDDLAPGDPVVLEMSSFQLGDLVFCRQFPGTAGAATRDAPYGEIPPLSASVAIITSIFPDHQDYYPSMDAYVADKHTIFQAMARDGLALIGNQDHWRESLAAAARASGAPGVQIGGAMDYADSGNLPGNHMRDALALAAAAALHLGVPPHAIRRGAATFPGVPHRLERVHRSDTRESASIEWINDTAATIPEAALAAVHAMEERYDFTVLIAGGSDKGIDLAPLVQGCRRVTDHRGAVILLAGTATPGLIAGLRHGNIPYHGPCASLEEAVALAHRAARERVHPGTSRVAVILSPGCASFGMFRNEFDRGNQFRELVSSL